MCGAPDRLPAFGARTFLAQPIQLVGVILGVDYAHNIEKMVW
jgi:hypothetical protein